MALWTDVIEPAELTAYARRSLDEVEAAKGNLGQFFPSTTVNDVSVRYKRGRKGLEDAAEYRAFDAEAPIGGRHGGERVTLDLPPISRKNLIGELDHIRSFAAKDDELKITIAKETDRLVKAVESRLEYARGQILETAKLDINENDFVVNVDLGRDESFTVTASTLWSEGGDPLEDLQAWAEVYSDENSEAPGTLIVSRKVRSLLQRHEVIRKAVAGVNTPSVVTVTALNELLASYDLPSITVYDRKVNVRGKITPVLSTDKLFFLPSDGNPIGETVFGRVAEVDDPDYGFVDSTDAPGIVAAAHKEHDPYSHWVRVNAIALPVLKAPNAAMVVKVA